MKQGFTLFELLIVVGIVALLSLFAVPAFRIFSQQQDVDLQAQQLIEVLRTAQNKTLASEGADSYGVYIDTSINPHQYVVFKGNSYATRDVSADEIHKLPSKVEFYNIAVAGNQVVYDKIEGSTAEPGTISLWLKADHTQSITVYVEAVGQVSLVQPPTASDVQRVKDSRHVHIEYTGRLINTSTENVVLTFPGGVTKTIPIAQNMQNGQIYWTGTVVVSGQNQVLTVATHVLNDSNLHTQFSVHRDMRYNAQAVSIQLSGDASGNLISYEANGQTTKGTSLYASNPNWQ